MKVFLLLIAFLLNSCSKKITSEPQTEVQKQYFRAMRNFDEENYSVALRLFEEFSKQNSLHKLARNSLQMEILLNFVNEKYQASDALSDIYLKFYAFDKQGCMYAEYMKIMSKSKIVKNEKISYEEAIGLDFMIQNFKKKYPNNEYLSEIFNKSSKNDEFICKSGSMIAEEYYNQKHFIAALKKYEEIKKYCKKQNVIGEKISTIKNILIN